MTVDDVLAWLEAEGTDETVEGMSRYGIPNDRAFGVPGEALTAALRRTVGQSGAPGRAPLIDRSPTTCPNSAAPTANGTIHV